MLQVRLGLGITVAHMLSYGPHWDLSCWKIWYKCSKGFLALGIFQAGLQTSTVCTLHTVDLLVIFCQVHSPMTLEESAELG